MTTTLWILGLLVALIVGLLIYAATRPDTFSVSRAIRVNVPASQVYPFLDDFRRWTAWSPWEKIDLDLRREFGGSERGVGATYGWEGSKTGKGRMEIVEARPNSLVKIDLDFFRPFKGHNVVTFALEEQSDGTMVTWTMTGRQPYMAKLMSTVMSMDKMMGQMFDQGLADLKRAAENSSTEQGVAT